MSAGGRLLKTLRWQTPAQTRWQGWLWQRTGPARSPSAEPLVIFAIPLVSKRRARDWAMVEANLAATLASFARQDDPSWRAVICGQDPPSQLPPGVEFLEAKVSDRFYDKGYKRRQLIDHVSRTLRRDGYYMQFDADDLLHPGFVGHVRGDHNGRGYLIDKGYYVDVGQRRAAPLFAPERPFHRTCGSSAAVYVDFRASRRDATLLRTHRSHTRVAEFSAYFGRSLDPVPFAAGLYLIGHGENMQSRRGRLDAKRDWVARHSVTGETFGAIERDFGVSFTG